MAANLLQINEFFMQFFARNVDLIINGFKFFLED
jgi:hypothetical protein